MKTDSRLRVTFYETVRGKKFHLNLHLELHPASNNRAIAEH